MKLYCAAVYTNHYRPSQDRWSWFTDLERECVLKADNILESYHYVRSPKFTRELHEDGAKIFVDSGAFSAYNLEKQYAKRGMVNPHELHVRDYVAWLKANWDLIKVEDGVPMCSVLDGIGDAHQTYRNQLEMEARGVCPLPCFHAGEDERYLEYYVSKYPYITLGGMVGAHTSQLMTWLDRIWDRYLTDGSGNARLKVHGFGITSEDLMKRYPWWSVDSSTWLQSASFGKIQVPSIGMVDISSKSPLRHDRGFHFINVSEMEREHIESIIRNDGFEAERLANVYFSRVAYNLWGFVRLQDEITESGPVTFQPPIQELY